MSKDEAKKFITKINSDKSFKEKILGAKNVCERMKIISEEGFEITKEEIELATDDFKNQDPELRRKEGLAGDLTDVLDILKYVIGPF